MHSAALYAWEKAKHRTAPAKDRKAKKQFGRGTAHSATLYAWEKAKHRTAFAKDRKAKK